MDKTKIIKIAIAVIIGILAIGYYFVNNKQNSTYENILLNDTIIENVSKEEKIEEEKTFIKVYVTGEVNSAGVIELEEGARIEDAIEGAGGITSNANLKNINLAYEVGDGEKIYIPNINENEEESVEETISTTSATEKNSTSSSSKGKININKAGESELTSIPGVGASTAEKIVSYRNENGKFSSIEEIKNVSGIGDGKYEKMKDYITVK